jgi:hypothetical protein
MPVKKSKKKKPKARALKKYRKPDLLKHGVLSIVEGD